jgi:hypothetical protein
MQQRTQLFSVSNPQCRFGSDSIALQVAGAVQESYYFKVNT